jgi:hypothetical protein
MLPRPQSVVEIDLRSWKVPYGKHLKPNDRGSQAVPNGRLLYLLAPSAETNGKSFIVISPGGASITR